RSLPQSVDVETLDGVPDQRWNAPVEVEQQGRDVHTTSLSGRRDEIEPACEELVVTQHLQPVRTDPVPEEEEEVARPPAHGDVGFTVRALDAHAVALEGHQPLTRGVGGVEVEGLAPALRR